MHQSVHEEEELEVTNEDFNFPALKDKSADSVTAEQVTGQQLPDRRVQEHHEYVSLDCGRAGLHTRRPRLQHSSSYNTSTPS